LLARDSRNWDALNVPSGAICYSIVIVEYQSATQLLIREGLSYDADVEALDYFSYGVNDVQAYVRWFSTFLRGKFS